jgi:predicted CXXCH cytochrome family protein
VALGASGGAHATALSCVSCHRDRRPGRFGRRHRTTTRCAACHEEAAHPRGARAAARPARACLACHDPHGSSNAALVRPAILRGGRRVPIELTNDAGAAPGGFTHPEAPGTGLCEACHRRTDVFRRDGGGEAHYTESCVRCHDHGAGFAPVVSDGNCGICHGDEAARLAKPSLHADRFACSACHAEAASAPGPGHRTAAPCTDCHDRQTHAPSGHAPLPCVSCHDPHGTDNRKLVLDRLPVTQGGERPIRFDNLLGRADGSFASASAPGTGVCEVCHTTTRFFRADGGGEPHFTFSCLPCHLHANGFRPR